MIHILPNHQRAVIFTLGKVSGVKGPGLVFMIPMLQTMTRVDMRETTAELPNAIVTYRVLDPAKAILGVVDYRHAMAGLAEATFRTVLAGRPTDAMVFERKGIEDEIRTHMNAAIPSWGIQVDKVEVKR